MALFSTVLPPSQALAHTLFRDLLCLLILAFGCYLIFLLQCNPVLKTLDQHLLSFVTWMSNIKEVSCKQILGISGRKEYGRHVVRRRRRRTRLRSMPLAILT